MSEFLAITTVLFIYEWFRKKSETLDQDRITPPKRTPTKPVKKPKLDTPEALHMSPLQESIAMIQDRLWDLDTDSISEFQSIKTEIIEYLEDMEPVGA